MRPVMTWLVPMAVAIGLGAPSAMAAPLTDGGGAFAKPAGGETPPKTPPEIKQKGPKVPKPKTPPPKAKTPKDGKTKGDGADGK